MGAKIPPKTKTPKYLIAGEVEDVTDGDHTQVLGMVHGCYKQQ